MTEYNKNTILLVDDEEFIQVVTKSMITSLGYDALTAGSGQDAITIFSQHHEDISLVVLDWNLPKMKAEQIIDSIREIRADIRILVSSGKSPDITKLANQEYFDLLPKPYTLSEFKEKIEMLLEPSKEFNKTI